MRRPAKGRRGFLRFPLRRKKMTAATRKKRILTKEEQACARQNLIYLATCAINDEIADSSRLADVEAVFNVASYHMLSALVAMTLEKSGIRHAYSLVVIAGALRRATLFQQAFEQIKSELTSAGIWHAALKGAELKAYYPIFGMREMADYDVLIDSTRAQDVKTIMEKLGFKTEEFGIDCHDIYSKGPRLTFEMHRSLFLPYLNKEVYEYYENVQERLVGDGFTKRFTPEDFYLYMIAHEHKHYSMEGTGLRSLVDTCLYLKNERLDLEYVTREAEKMGLADFEASNRALSTRLFAREKLDVEESKTLDFFLASGFKGNYLNVVQNGLGKWGKLGYIASRFFIPVSRKNARYKSFASRYPTFYKYKLLLPFLPFYRVVRSVMRGRFFAEAKALKKAKRV